MHRQSLLSHDARHGRCLQSHAGARRSVQVVRIKFFRGWRAASSMQGLGSGDGVPGLVAPTGCASAIRYGRVASGGGNGPQSFPLGASGGRGGSPHSAGRNEGPPVWVCSLFLAVQLCSAAPARPLVHWPAPIYAICSGPAPAHSAHRLHGPPYGIRSYSGSITPLHIIPGSPSITPDVTSDERGTRAEGLLRSTLKHLPDTTMRLEPR